MAETCGRSRCDRTCLPGSVPVRSVLRAIGRLALVLAVVGAATVVLPVVTAIPGHHRQHRAAAALRALSRVLLRAIGIRVHRRGTPATGPCLVVANHLSWLDVLVLTSQSAMVPLATSEVAQWPLIGGVARRLGVPFVRREQWRGLPDSVDQLTALLRRGHRVQVFPESTTRCGSSLLRFHRAVFQSAVDAAVVIAPVSLGYRAADGLPSEAVTFVGDDLLVSSLWRILRGGAVTACVRWLPVIPATVGTEHKARSRALAAWRAERAVASALGRSVAGRPPVRRVPDAPPHRPRPLTAAA